MHYQTIYKWMEEYGISRYSQTDAKLPRGLKKPTKEEIEKSFSSVKNLKDWALSLKEYLYLLNLLDLFSA